MTSNHGIKVCKGFYLLRGIALRLAWLIFRRAYSPANIIIILFALYCFMHNPFSWMSIAVFSIGYIIFLSLEAHILKAVNRAIEKHDC